MHIPAEVVSVLGTSSFVRAGNQLLTVLGSKVHVMACSPDQGMYATGAITIWRGPAQVIPALANPPGQAVVGPVQRTNLVPNPGFVNGTAMWSTTAETSAAPGEGVGGSDAMAITDSAGGAIRSITYTTSASPGQVYSARVSVRPAAPLGATWFVRLLDSAGATVAQADVPAGTAWSELSVTSSALPPGTTHVSLVIGTAAGAAGDSLFVDNALLELAPSAGPYFDGDTPDAGGLIYSWAGAPNSSSSTVSAQMAGTTNDWTSLAWRPYVVAADDCLALSVLATVGTIPQAPPA